MTEKELASFPGIIGYIASNEETLWDIAKHYKTTVEKIRSVNKISGDCVKRGDIHAFFNILPYTVGIRKDCLI